MSMHDPNAPTFVAKREELHHSAQSECCLCGVIAPAVVSWGGVRGEYDAAICRPCADAVLSVFALQQIAGAT